MNLGNMLMDHAVLQRNKNNVSEHVFSGSCQNSGKLLLTVKKNGSVLSGFDKIVIGKAENGKLQGCIKNLPVGGPYMLTVGISGTTEKLTVKDVLVGDLWLLAGQSNMADSGFMPSCSETNEFVHAFYMNNLWNVAREPLHDIVHAAAPVHGGNPANPYPRKCLRGTGPGLPFGVEMYKATGVPQGLIACAHGGTSMDQWNPALKKKGDYSLYGALYNRLKNLGGKVAGVLWYQGCNDTGTPEKALVYERKTRKLFAAFRKDCQAPDLPIVFAQLATTVPMTQDIKEPIKFAMVRYAQYNIGQTLKNCACVPTIDLGLDDLIHLSNAAVATLGKRFAYAMQRLKGNNDLLPEISVDSVKCQIDPVTTNAVLMVKFKNVCGKLIANGNPRGFSVLHNSDIFVSEAVKTRLEGDTAIVTTRQSAVLFSQLYKLAYGSQLFDHCNITDEAGRSLPCVQFKARAVSSKLSSVVLEAMVSEPVFTDDSFTALPLLENFDSLKYSPIYARGFYLPTPPVAEKYIQKQKVFVYKFRVNLVEDMKLKMYFGADAPFMLYIDGKEFQHQCTGNPVVIDEFKYPLALTAGRHDITCVFSSNRGCGWGICCRFKRMDGKKVPEFLPVEQ